MKVRLAGGVVVADTAVWTAGPAGPERITGGSSAPPGAPVALGPAGAGGEDVRRALAELSALVAAGGATAAGAGVDLGAGFRSARLDGARGDRRDAVLAALRALGLRNAGRLGDRAGFLVALFGPSVTKRVGAAAAKAAGDGRWAALHLASAASDVLGPEQLERVLDLDGPDAAVPGAPSVLAGYLRQAFGGVPRPRRLDLLLDLWERVRDRRDRHGRRARRMATQSRRDRLSDLRERRARDEDDLVVGWLTRMLGIAEPTLADAARWIPPDAFWRDQLTRMFEDAIAATALLRTAVAVADLGYEEGLARSAPLIEAVVAQCPAWAAGRRRDGGLPARPTVHVGEIHRRLSAGDPIDARVIGVVRPRLVRAREYALLVIETVETVLTRMIGHRADLLREWGASSLKAWRDAAGYSDVRPPDGWDGIPPWTGPLLGDRRPLRDREELLGDLLWYVDLVDALAQLHGHDAARSVDGTGAPWFDHDPPPAEPEPFTPRLDSVTLAVSGAAQLAALGGVPPKGARTWTAFTDGLAAGTAIAEALTGEFAVPPPVAAADGAVVPGAKVRVKVARNARDLAEWSDRMGNCIAGPMYLDDARAGRVALLGLYDGKGVLVVNAELSPLRPQARGWRVSEIAARFNEAPAEELERAFRSWVDALPGITPPEEPPPEELPPARPARRRAAPRLVEDVGPVLGDLARAEWDASGLAALEVVAAVAATPPDAALTRLRRLGSGQLTAAVRRALDGGVPLVRLWDATAARPLEAALGGLDPALRDRYDQLPLLLGEPPLPKTLRRLVKLPALADPYALDLVGRRVRAAIGRLALLDDPVIARAVAHRTTGPLLCALTVLVTCAGPEIPLATVVPPRKIRVPGYPATTLKDGDGPWLRALPDAAELGAATGSLWDAVAAHGLRVPASWLGAGGWTALWSRAHAHP
ncbi:hypothetical protein F8568_037690 [Actinomadura sp. LD22]|uniref:Uncharacterized protein n=1 Tax=Actinomadura physcomitrii TaxID=2650748 RepID=A0A6I4MM20_9ACTN|nr:hypothetical protein [Actinomadura physcomitrii]MWA05990.1 hypothetical protein [Actinomadura physcomitrii]